MTDRAAADARIEAVSKGCLERGDCLLRLARGQLEDVGLLFGSSEVEQPAPARRSRPGLPALDAHSQR
jgi:hypothetical protein